MVTGHILNVVSDARAGDGRHGLLDPQDGATDRFGDLRHYGIAICLDDQTGRRCPSWTADSNAHSSQPGGYAIIQP